MALSSEENSAAAAASLKTLEKVFDALLVSLRIATR